MKTAFTCRRPIMSPEYRRNALLQLVLAISVAYIVLYSVYIIVLVISEESLSKTLLQNVILPQVALQSFEHFIYRPWILLSYAWGHASFFGLLSNMLWLYCFGSVIQSLVGYKEIIPLYIISTFCAGVIYLVCSMIWPNMQGTKLIIGSFPGVMSFAIASITLAPSFRFYLGERLSIPLWLVLSIYLFLNLINFIPNNTTMIVISSAGAFIGFVYIKLMQNRSKPGVWVYNLLGSVNDFLFPGDKIKTPQPPPLQHQTKITIKQHFFHQKKDFRQLTDEEYIDSLLDKINQKGYDSLTKEEKDALLKASQK